MNRAKSIRVILELALIEAGFESKLQYFDITSKDVDEFLSLGEQAVNDIDEQFASEEPA